MGGRAGWACAALVFLCGCAASSPPAPEPQPPEAIVEGCTPTTCAEAGAACGKITDGCGAVLECGSCAAGETCGAGGPNRCGVGACQPQSCASANVACGQLTDGCGGIAECGDCAQGQQCHAGQCACTPKTCAELGASCGQVADGCGGTLECGGCPAGETCGGDGPNKCGASSCPAATCASKGAQCGAISDGCGAVLNCGTCGENNICVGNSCECQPKTCGAQCGTLSNGCGGTLNCGACPDLSCATTNAGSSERFEVGPVAFVPGGTPQGDAGNSHAVISWTAPKSGPFVFDTATSWGRQPFNVYESCTGGTGSLAFGGGGEGTVARTWITAQAGHTYLFMLPKFPGFPDVGDVYFHGSPLEQTESSCTDRTDNDADGLIDCSDPHCSGTPQCFNSACGAVELTSAAPLTQAVHTGPRSWTNESCNGTQFNSPEAVFGWTAPRSGTFVFFSDLYAGELRVARGCSTTTLACRVNSAPRSYGDARPAAKLTMTQGQHVVIFAQPNDPENIPRSALVTLKIREDSGAELDCNDIYDDDADGKADCVDPDCGAPRDCGY